MSLEFPEYNSAWPLKLGLIILMYSYHILYEPCFDGIMYIQIADYSQLAL